MIAPWRCDRFTLAALLLAVLLGGVEARAQGQEEMCLACHGQADLKSPAGRSVYVDPARHKSSVHGGLGCTSCHTTLSEYPHPKRVPRVVCAACHADAAAAVPGSAHGSLGAQACAACHSSAHATARAATAAPAQCAACHAAPVNEYKTSVHALQRSNGDADGATCASCHGPAHRVIPQRDPASSVARKNLPATCGSCHANPEFLARHKVPFARPVESFRLSVHGRALERGNDAAASCSDCHASHAIFPARDTRSRINHWKVPETCGTCHSAIRDTYDESVHGQAVARGVAGAPVCTSCHGEHTILAPSEPQSLVNPARVSSVTCGRCHADERLAQRYNLSLEKVPAFQDSFHGLAVRGGSQTVANCASCHGVHNILPSSDPRSTIHPANLAKTCGRCHPGAGERFAIGAVHVAPGTSSEHPAVKWIRVAYLVLIPLTLGFMLLHHAVDFFAKLRRGAARHTTGETVQRMNLHFRIAHGLVMLSFPVLVATGFALKFPESWWAAPLLHWESQFAFRGTLHRIAGVVLVAAILYHVVHLAASRRDRVILEHLRPVARDLSDLLGMLKYNLGLSNERPPFGKFSYAEKLEYLAFVWGSVMMAVSGFLLWFNNFALRYFPKWVIDAATAIHYYEAILAALSILVWHFYLVMFDPEVYPMDLAWLTGKASAEHLRRTRPAYFLELARSEAAGGELRSAEAAPPAMAPVEPPAPAPPAAAPDALQSQSRQDAGGTKPAEPAAAAPAASPAAPQDPKPPEKGE